jgi:hypothetical protein
MSNKKKKKPRSKFSDDEMSALGWAIAKFSGIPSTEHTSSSMQAILSAYARDIPESSTLGLLEDAHDLLGTGVGNEDLCETVEEWREKADKWHDKYVSSKGEAI